MRGIMVIGRNRPTFGRVEVLLLCVVSMYLCHGASGQIRYSVPEESKKGTFVGNIAKDLGFDVNTLTERRFRIVSGSKENLLQINQDNGALYVYGDIDRESICEKNSQCFINLKIAVENPLEIHYVEVEIMDINDHSPVFPEKEKHLEISENAAVQGRFPLDAARDPDVGVNSLRKYSLSSNNHFDLDVKSRGEEKIPFLILKKPLDREQEPEVVLMLTAYDGGKPEKSGSVNISITVLDINDNTPVFERQVYTVNLAENAPPGTSVVTLRATDLDEGENGQVIYAFDQSLKNKALDIFQIDAFTGEITVKGAVDFEEKSSYEIDVQASDKGQVALVGHSSVIINVKDVNDNAPEIDVTSLSGEIPENVKPGTTITLISVSDKDSGDNGVVICSLENDVPFELKPSFQRHMYSLVTKSRLDRESASVYTITIAAVDKGDPPLSSQKTIGVDISDINDNSPVFSHSPYTFYLVENNTPGAVTFSLSASDLDQNENAQLAYSIIKGEGADHSVVSFLNINSENGDVYALKSFDFETTKTFQFNVLAMDAGRPPLSSNVTVHVFILDQNDNAPVILSPVSANGSAEGVEEIARNAKAGHLVTKVRAYDADVGYNGWLLFSIQEVSDHTLFGLDRYTGQIRTIRPFTETDEPQHKLVILVKDNGNTSLSATATVIINAVEPKEAFSASEVNNAAADMSEDNVTFYLIITLGSVSFLFLISIVVLVVMQCSKPKDYSSKYLQDTNYDGTLCHSIQYRSGDKRYMLVGPRMSIGSTIVPGSNGNTLVVPDRRSRASGEPKPPNADWRYSASLRAGMQSSVHMEESSVMQGAQGVLVQNWPTVSSAADGVEGGEVSPPMGAGVDSNSWHFRYGGPPGPQHLKPGEMPPEAFIIPGSPAIISIRQGQEGDDKSDFITFGKKEEAKKKKKKKKEKKDKREKGKDDDE
ncbi:protocadherin alpha-3-like isoform X11 [Alosa alosa]|uniref:protocadherin alpha-3-like isoform X11 n=1 Tax=Alosa alosa TaxID=278164 RepID=UPI0020154804|nr:protocadherin alpha-3-like isoform X11 [Alosa alosa]